MAEEEKTEEQAPKEETEAKPKSLIAKLLPWVILLVITAASAAGGFGLSCMLAAPAGEEGAEAQAAQPAEKKKEDGKSAKPWYYDKLEPVVANLDEPGATRYVRAVLVLEMNAELDEDEGTKFLTDMNPGIVDWLHVYLMSLTLDDVTGKNNINRVQAQILDSLNELLWPNSKPMIKRVLIKEFPIQ
jgi:flagellar basal body-associated protein FliL